MTTFYSELFGESADDPQTEADPGFVVDLGDFGGIIRYKRAFFCVPNGYEENSNIRMLTLHSSDRIIAHYVSSSGFVSDDSIAWKYASSLAFDRDGSIYGTAWTGLSILTAQEKKDVFQQGDLENDDRGKPLWEHIEEEYGGVFTEDPRMPIDLILDISIAGAPVISDGGDLVV